MTTNNNATNQQQNSLQQLQFLNGVLKIFFCKIIIFFFETER